MTKKHGYGRLLKHRNSRLEAYKLSIDVKMTIHIAGKKHTYNSSTDMHKNQNFLMRVIHTCV
jgi:hypothetical protein